MKIAILGASKSHLPLYLKAKELGLEIYCIAWDKGAYCKEYADHFYDISITEKEQIAELCLLESISGIVANAIEEAVPTIAYVSEKCGFNGNSYQTALCCTNKLAMRQCLLNHANCKQPDFKLVNTLDVEVTHYPVIVKPVDASCSKGVSKAVSQYQLTEAIERALTYSSKKEVLVEQFIDGCEVSVESISFHGEHYILTITDKETTGAPNFVELAHHQPSQLPNSIQNKITESTKTVLNGLGISNGASHVEFKVTPDGDIYFIEAGARGGGDCISYKLVELSTGYDYIKGMIEVALNKFTKPVIKSLGYSGIYFLCKETSYLLDIISKSKSSKWLLECDLGTDPLISIEKSQDRSGYFIYKSDQKIVF